MEYDFRNNIIVQKYSQQRDFVSYVKLHLNLNTRLNDVEETNNFVKSHESVALCLDPYGAIVLHLAH